MLNIGSSTVMTFQPGSLVFGAAAAGLGEVTGAAMPAGAAAAAGTEFVGNAGGAPASSRSLALYSSGVSTPASNALSSAAFLVGSMVTWPLAAVSFAELHPVM